MDPSRRPQSTHQRANVRAALAASLLVVVLLPFGAHAQEPPDPFVRADPPPLDARYETALRELAASPAGLAFLDALLLIDREYLYSVDRDALLRGATAGLIAALDDPYSRYVAPDEVAARRSDPRREAGVTATMLGDVGYLGVPSFEADGVGAAVGRAIDAHLLSGARALVLDLRGNVGGSILQGLQVLDRFLADGVLGFRRVRGVSVPIAYANPRAVSLPLVVLVDDVTASTAEIVAGALQAYERARLVGTVTAGKGIGQTAIELTDGAEIQLVSFEWLLPGFRSIDGSGLRPDLEVSERRIGETTTGNGVQGMRDVANDPVLRAALQLLREAIGDDLAAPITVPVPTPGVGPTVMPMEPNDTPADAPGDADDAEADDAPADEPTAAPDDDPDPDGDDEVERADEAA
jgi:C-terminal processing protease CtpA/Prc